MLQLRNISKSYTTGDFTQVALNSVSLNFRQSEFVAILGQSGSGKTTFLNVIGGLDRYDSGDLIISGKSTKSFRDKDWDAYRNRSVGFVFQSYNLIPHLNIVDNVEMGMTLSGVSAAKRHHRAVEVLKRVGLQDHLHKRPNQLSGGQMQRVAIARALVNNPDIILADEPTGALDTQTSEQIMDLIKEIAADKLVIMVTHNPELATRYADRVVRFSDGKVVSDTRPLSDEEVDSHYRLRRTSMSFMTALKLSGKNILTKKWRTTLTAFASSIGIIGIALVLSLSNGFDQQISSYETGALSNFPITINQTAMSLDPANRPDWRKQQEGAYPDTPVIYPYDPSENSMVHTNVLTPDYLDYVSKIDPTLLDGISYQRSLNLNLLKSDGTTATPVSIKDINLTSYPSKPEGASGNYLEQYYDLLAGQYPTGKTDLVLVVDDHNRLKTTTLQALGLPSEKETLDFDQVLGHELKLIMNNDYYKKSGDYYTVNGNAADLMTLYKSGKATTLKIVGVVRAKKDATIASLSAGVAYSDELAKYFIANAQNSDVVKAQKAASFNVLNGSPLAEKSSGGVLGQMAQMGMDNGGRPGQPQAVPGQGLRGTSIPSLSKDEVLGMLGATEIPTAISLYPVNFDAKEQINAYLDAWNTGKAEDDQIQYTDMASIVTKLSGGIMDGITIVLVAFAAISLVVSLIMIGIITYISVMERTREIGVLRALGARKKDISRVFNAETFIIGTFSGLLGIGIAYLLTIPTNHVLYNLTELENVAQLNPVHAFGLVVVSVCLTMLGGFIPAKMAAKKDPVIALRTE
jgi:ABC-type lipoprotein export system ATPase subunit/ABC-type antimicrobial peptide transport system permease subunit